MLRPIFALLFTLLFSSVLPAQPALNNDLREMARRGQTPRVQALLKAGARVDAPDENGRTALMLAALQGYWQTMVVLLDAGANAAATDRGGKTAQTLADESGHKEIAQLLAIDPTERRRWEKEDNAALKAYRENRYAEAEAAWRAALERAKNFGTGTFSLPPA